MSDKDREFRVQMDILRKRFFIDSSTIGKAYATLDKVQEFLEGSMSEDNLAVVDMVEQAKSHLDEWLAHATKLIEVEEDWANLQRTVDEYFPDPSS